MMVLYLALGLVALFGVMLLVRNQCVWSYRRRVLNAVSAAAQRDIAQNSDSWQRHYDAFDTVSYGRMIAQFWRRLDSFYRGAEFWA